MLGVAGLGKGADVTCSAGCWGMKGKNVFEAMGKQCYPTQGVVITHGTHGQGFLQGGRARTSFCQVYRCPEVLGLSVRGDGGGILGSIPVLRLQDQHLLPCLVWERAFLWDKVWSDWALQGPWQGKGSCSKGILAQIQPAPNSASKIVL